MNELVKDCMNRVNDDERERIRVYLNKIDKEISMKMIDYLLNLPSGLSETALRSHLADKFKKRKKVKEQKNEFLDWIYNLPIKKEVKTKRKHQQSLNKKVK